MEEIVVKCPHCTGSVLIMSNEINCAIFRHGVYKKNYKQINPHEKKEICDKLLKEDLIFGCGKPFRLEKTDKSYCACICDYI
jgi:hypothetical protein